MSLRDFFNQHAPKSTTGIFSHVLEHVEQGQGGIAYDLCCGTGGLSAALQDKGYQSYGVDIAERFIGTEGKSASGYILGDINRLPFADASASLVTCIDSLQYFHQPELVLAEMSRVLAPNGRLIFSTQNNYNPAGLKKWLIKRSTGRDWSPWLLHPIENFVTYPWLIKTLESEGFTVDYVRGKQFLTAWVSLLPTGLRNWSPPNQGWRSLSAIAGRTHLPRPIEESALARFAMIVLISARKKA